MTKERTVQVPGQAPQPVPMQDDPGDAPQELPTQEDAARLAAKRGRAVLSRDGWVCAPQAPEVARILR